MNVFTRPHRLDEWSEALSGGIVDLFYGKSSPDDTSVARFVFPIHILTPRLGNGVNWRRMSSGW